MGFLPFTARDSPIVFGLLWTSFQDYPLTHWLPRPLPLFNSCLLHHYSFHDKIPFCLFLLYTSTSLPSSMACIRWSQPFITSFGKISSSQDIFPKRIHGRKPNIDPLFPLTTKPRPLNPLNCGPTSLVLARYRLVVLRPFCACSIVFCVCLPRCFYCSRLVMFRYAACFILFLRVFLATFVIFLWFGFSSLHMIPTADASCHSLFLFIVLLHISFHTYPFTQNNLGRCGPDNVDWIKRVLGPICLCLPEPFCQGTVLCGRFVFCGRFAFCYRYLYTKGFEKGLGPNLSSSAKAILPGNCILRQICILLQIPFPCTSFFGPFLLFGLLGRPLGLAFHWAFLRMGFWI